MLGVEIMGKMTLKILPIIINAKMMGNILGG
jgi:hypothetical protein